jgi:hypothetical protein
VPETVDRTVQTKLGVQATVRADTASTETVLEPLAGATAPALHLNVSGMAPGQSLSKPVTIKPVPLSNVPLASVEYLVDGEIVHTAGADNAPFTFDPASLAPGNHTLLIRIANERGRTAEAQLPFIIPTPSEGVSLPIVPILAILVVAAIAYLLFNWVRRHPFAPRPERYRERLGPWHGRNEAATPAGQSVDGWPEREPPTRTRFAAANWKASRSTRCAARR